jgi:hypothetical protein
MGFDPKPENETAGKLRAAAGCGPLDGSRTRTNSEEKSQRRADYLRLAPSRSRKKSKRDLPGNGRVAASFLPLEAAICRPRLERTARAAPVARRESQTEDLGGRPDAGQAHSAGDAIKKGLKPAARRELVRKVRQAYQLSENRACGLIGITRWINRYQSARSAGGTAHPFAGSGGQPGSVRISALTVQLRREGWRVNTKRVYRLYREEGLQVQRVKRAKRATHVRVPLSGAVRPNQRWSMDFVSDRLADGGWFRILTVIDQYTRECLCRRDSAGQGRDNRRPGVRPYSIWGCCRRLPEGASRACL